MSVKKIVSLLLLIVLVCSSIVIFAGCEEGWEGRLPDFSFSGKWKTSEDGFKYYVDDEVGLCITRFPYQDEIVVPEIIDGMRVMQLGCKTPKPILGEDPITRLESSVKKLTITQPLNLYAVGFPYLEILTLIDCWNIYQFHSTSPTAFRIDFASTSSGTYAWVHPKIHLLKGGKDIIWDKKDIDVIEISQCVTVIEKGTFDGIENVVLKTEWESQPEGWQDGWNSGLEIEWGVTFE